MYLGLIEIYGLISFVKEVFRYDCNITNSKKKFFRFKGIFSHLVIRVSQSGDQLLPNVILVQVNDGERPKYNF